MEKESNQPAGQEWVYGLHSVQAVLKTEPERITEIRVLKGRHDQRLNKIRALAEQHDIPISGATRDELEALAPGNHQGVIARCTTGDVRDDHYLFSLLERLDHPPMLLVLDGVTDPHNLGACLRTADAAGVDAVIAPKDNSAGITATVRKVASGAAETVPFVVVTNLSRTLKQLQELGVWITGTDGDASSTLFQADLKGPMALVMGAEGKGMRRLTKEHCDVLVNLPMAGSVSSLNVSVAAGVCLYEAVRQRQGHGQKK
ncbi:MAG: 23S rRNA methyltransferase [Gammaproteobacteria bacterium BRH_c0]|nr:MAG: 23S rRNA methyltransferase [Gammaproteobacteria bacterium BRH_c0]